MGQVAHILVGHVAYVSLVFAVSWVLFVDQTSGEVADRLRPSLTFANLEFRNMVAHFNPSIHRPVLRQCAGRGSAVDA